MYAFLWRPRWILSHLLVLALIVAMIAAMFWQISRLHEKQAANRLVAANSVRAPVVPSAFDAALAGSTIAKLQYRRVEVTGTYDTSAEVLIESRTLNGAPGRWVATPLVPSDGSTPILVVRGFVPLAVDDTTPPFHGAEPPSGQVTAVGWAQPTQTKGFFGSTDAPSGTLHVMARVDVARFARQFGTVKPYWLQLSAQLPATSEHLLSGVPLPEPDEGPHKGYAGQWAIFTLIAIVGYPLILRRNARNRQLEEAVGGDGPDPIDEADPAQPTPVDADTPARDRIMDAVVVCADRVGLAGFALEDVAAEAGTSRATIYRYFTGGRDQLIRETVTREVGRFWGELAAVVAEHPDVESRLVFGIMAANQRIRGYDLLQRLLDAEPEEILPALMSSEPLVHQVLRDYVRQLIDSPDLLDGVDLDEAADYVTRMLLAHIGTAGQWDIDDEDEVRRLVRTQFLAGVIAPGGLRAVADPAG